MRSRAVPLLLPLLWIAGGAPARGELVDRIVAIVDREVVTLSEAEQAGALARARTGAEAPLAELVERLIESRLIEREVERFSGEPIPPERVDEAFEELRSSFVSESAFRDMMEATGFTEEGLRARLARQLAVAAYLERRFRPLVFVTDADVEAYYRDELLPELADRPAPEPSEVAEPIRRLLEERRFNARVEGWIDDLKMRSHIRRYVW